MTITFETKVWEGDKDLVLSSKNLSEKIRRCYHHFDKKIIYVNNVDDIADASRKAQVLIDEGIIDNFVVVEDYADEALSFFGLTRDSLTTGYYYSIAELVSVYLCDTKYLLHFSGDSMPSKDVPRGWVSDGIEALNFSSNTSVFNLTWNNDYAEAKRESFFENDTLYFGHGFSDQMYLIETDVFKKRIYNYFNEASNRYPKHAGELFEKRIDSWMRKTMKIRATYKLGSYIHPTYEG